MTDPTESFATPRVAAGALFFDPTGRVLLVHPTYKDTWDVPGGYVEHGESPAAGCRRELAEELGLDRTPVRLLSVDWAPSDKEGDKLLFLFDCGHLGDPERRPRRPTSTRCRGLLGSRRHPAHPDTARQDRACAGRRVVERGRGRYPEGVDRHLDDLGCPGPSHGRPGDPQRRNMRLSSRKGMSPVRTCVTSRDWDRSS